MGQRNRLDGLSKTHLIAEEYAAIERDTALHAFALEGHQCRRVQSGGGPVAIPSRWRQVTHT